MNKSLGVLLVGVVLTSSIYFVHTDFAAKSTDTVSVLGESVQNSSTAMVIVVKGVVAQPVGQNQRVTVTAVVDNQSGSVVQISPGLQFWITDENGIQYPYTAEYIDPQTVLGGPLIPNESTTLLLDFSLPAEATFKTLQFQSNASEDVLEVML